jgi:hypothetical protein
MRDPGQASSVLLRGLVRAAGELGVDRDRLLAACGTSDVELDHGVPPNVYRSRHARALPVG